MKETGLEADTTSIDTSSPYLCPMCNSNIGMVCHEDNIPYFGNILEVCISCTCGYKYVDTIILDQKEPLRHSKQVSTECDMSVRVIRSTSGTVRVPEWGIDIEPGPASEGYITNVEGLIERMESVVHMAKKWSEQPDEHVKADWLLNQMVLAREGKAAFTLVIEDPLGNSAIIGEDVQVTPLKAEEANDLHTGMFIVQK